MSHFFEDVGNVVTSPFREISGIVTGNPKYNSLEDIYNQSLGDSNPIADVFQNEGLNKAARIFSLPTWDSLGKPAQAFSEFVDTQNSVLPADWRPYAQSVEALALSAFNPFAGAAFQTAYNAGQNQAQPGSFDWGAFGKDAAINFGTAALSSGASKLLQNASAADASKAFNASDAGLHAPDVLNSLGPDTSSLAGFSASAAPQLAANSAAALNTVGAVPGLVSAAQGPQTAGNTLRSFGSGTDIPRLDASTSSLPYANTLQSSGIGDAAYKASLKAAPGLGNQALTSTLAPEGVQPIAGALDSFTPTANTGTGENQWGDVLNAFGGNELNTPNSEGPRIDANAFNAMVDRLGANSYLQQNQVRDTALPAGQYQSSLNTPYANRLSEINKGTTQSYADLLDQVNNANRYYGVLDTNPGLTSDQLDTYINNPEALGQVQNANNYYNVLNANQGLTSDQLDTYLKDPSSGALGAFSVSPDQAPELANIKTPTLPNDFFKPGQIAPAPPDISYLQGIRTLGPQNLSLTY